MTIDHLKTAIAEQVPRLQSWEVDGLAKKLEREGLTTGLGGQEWKDMLEAVVREADKESRWRGGYQKPWTGTENAPGHAHSITGIWDSDNGPIAGKPCSWCIAWNAARKALS